MSRGSRPRSTAAAWIFARYARMLSGVERRERELHVGVGAREAEPAAGAAGRDDDRLAVGERDRVERPVEREVLAAVLHGVELRAVGVAPAAPGRR